MFSRYMFKIPIFRTFSYVSRQNIQSRQISNPFKNFDREKMYSKISDSFKKIPKRNQMKHKADTQKINTISNSQPLENENLFENKENKENKIINYENIEPSEPIIMDTKAKYWYKKISHESKIKREQLYDKLIDYIDGGVKSAKQSMHEGVIMREIRKILKEAIHKIFVILAKIIFIYQLGKLIPKGIELLLVKRYKKKMSTFNYFTW